jgi:hypothetical protein
MLLANAIGAVQMSNASARHPPETGGERGWFGCFTLVRLVYLLEPALGLRRARWIHAAAGDLVRVPPLHRRQRKHVSCSVF